MIVRAEVEHGRPLVITREGEHFTHQHSATKSAAIGHLQIILATVVLELIAGLLQVELDQVDFVFTRGGRGWLQEVDTLRGGRVVLGEVGRVYSGHYGAGAG